jgi:hypothetical protein
MTDASAGSEERTRYENDTPKQIHRFPRFSQIKPNERPPSKESAEICEICEFVLIVNYQDPYSATAKSNKGKRTYIHGSLFSPFTPVQTFRSIRYVDKYSSLLAAQGRQFGC